MVIDSSAVIAILWEEPEGPAIADCIERDSVRLISAANWLETQMVVQGRFGFNGGLRADTFFRKLRVEIVPFDAVLAQLALTAWQRFGKGNHAARLNIGDCFAYATAIVKNQPLLFKGGNFDKTDVARVSY